MESYAVQYLVFPDYAGFFGSAPDMSEVPEGCHSKSRMKPGKLPTTVQEMAEETRKDSR